MNQQTIFYLRFNYESFWALLILLPAIFACSQFDIEGKRSSKPKEEKRLVEEKRPVEEKGLVGTWKNQEATVRINADGTMLINNVKYRYKASRDVITVTGNDGTVEIPYGLDDDTLTVTYEGREAIYQRVNQSQAENDKPDSGGVMPELVGKWCYLSSVTANNGGRMSDRCITLNANGSYQYYAETSSSGDYGGTYSQESDSGTWNATENTITANSQSQGVRTYSLEKRNHPKTGDPMIVIDGDAYVTYAQRNPW
jgi:hypothetical protein